MATNQPTIYRPLAETNHKIPAIETAWRGFRCRSRLEARWCVFFDSIGIEFDYEPEGYQLPNGKRYLPDFYLRHLDMFAECKPDRWNTPAMNEDFLKAQEFVMGGMSNKVLYLVGVPDFRPYLLFRRIDLPDGSESWLGNASLDIYGKPRRYFEERRLYEDFPDEEFTGEHCFSARYQEAVYAARGERFEGEQ